MARSKTLFLDSSKLHTSFFNNIIKKFKYEFIPRIKDRTKVFIKWFKGFVIATNLKNRCIDIGFTSLVVACILWFYPSRWTLLKGLSIVLFIELALAYLKQMITTIKKALK